MGLEEERALSREELILNDFTKELDLPKRYLGRVECIVGEAAVIVFEDETEAYEARAPISALNRYGVSAVDDFFEILIEKQSGKLEYTLRKMEIQPDPIEVERLRQKYASS